MIVTKETQNAVMRLIGDSFAANRFIDRVQTVIGVSFAYNNTAKLIHHGIAHYMPLLADNIGERCLERYNIPIVYAPTPAGDEIYASVMDAIDALYNYIIEYQALFMGVCEIAQNNKDIHVYAELLDLLKDFNKIVEQVILLKDKIHLYGKDPSFDAHVLNHFNILIEE